MKRVFVDTNVLLDVALARQPHWPHSAAVLDLCETSPEIVGLSSTLALANFYYILCRAIGAEAARRAVARARELLEIRAVRDKELGEALVSDFADLEDGVQYFTAVHGRADLIVTRNTAAFRPAAIPVMSPAELLAFLAL